VTNILAPVSFRAQVGLIAVASLAMAALAVLLIQDVLASAERTLVTEALQQCTTASRELAQQLVERREDPDRTDARLPVPALDLSLRGVTSAVLRSYDGVTAGYFRDQQVLGAAESGGVQPLQLERREWEALRALVASGQNSISVSIGEGDVFVLAAQPVSGSAYTAWAAKRIRGVRDPSALRRRWGLLALALLAALAVGGVIAVSIRLRQGLDRIDASLRRMEQDFDHRVPQLPGEFGRISWAVNRMADRRRALETELRQQDRLAALGKVVAGVAHEIRNPLNSMRLTLELAQRRMLRSGQSGTVELAGALDEVDRLDGIVGRLLTFGRPDTASPREPHDLLRSAERVLRILQPQAAERRIELRLSPEDQDEPYTAKVDAGSFEQCLINLLLNAMDAAPPESCVEIRLQRSNDSIHLEVQDEGAGVPASVREHIFDPYFTTKPTGNGLGLALAREFAVSHGGSLALRPNEEGREGGARFILTLPPAGVPHGG
jgi:signal transduction histidine kinase